MIRGVTNRAATTSTFACSHPLANLPGHTGVIVGLSPVTIDLASIIAATMSPLQVVAELDDMVMALHRRVLCLAGDTTSCSPTIATATGFPWPEQPLLWTPWLWALPLSGGHHRHFGPVIAPPSRTR
jgi:hypothetical protein